MAETHLGELRLFAKNPSGNFFTWPISNANLTDELESRMLDNPQHIDGFNTAGEDVELVEDQPSTNFLPIEIEAGTRRIFGTFQDAENADKQYEITVYLLVEEPEPKVID